MASNVTVAHCFDFTVNHLAGTVKDVGWFWLKDVFLYLFIRGKKNPNIWSTVQDGKLFPLNEDI